MKTRSKLPPAVMHVQGAIDAMALTQADRRQVVASTVDQRRAAMPVVAEFIDMCRREYGADLVDRQLATAQKARREHAEILAMQGQHAADRWLKANAHRCTFHAVEQGRTLGLQSPYGRTEAGTTTQA